MIFDTHAHYDDEQFDIDRDSLLLSMKENGIGTIVNIGANLRSSQTTLELAHKYDFVYGAVGVHPSDSAELSDDNFDQIRQMSSDPKCVAIGEIGLDYYWPEPDHETQKKWFVRQLDLAREVGLPVVIHSRDAAADTVDILRDNKAGELGGVVHCFSYSKEVAAECVKMGFYIGVGGVLTFKNGKKMKEVVSEIPIERIILETDCPYLAPEPNRGKRNSSLNLPYVVTAMAQIKGISEEEVIEITERNAREMYRLK
ncbi:TatD family deoxyribonuclease [Butyrivibrio sp. CB08]|uniref:TatD family hydrolase n=1 Tax=Butyrivibrio sp. CB08 TaxID=2364879 RepID=UPI000EA96788|nr:TatD family hydrolase [Butyrivibrio sp. CB08]RKM58889.1 TatD family deoxyribonuclease [Butyrivibrio sp. CB08]